MGPFEGRVLYKRSRENKKIRKILYPIILVLCDLTKDIHYAIQRLQTPAQVAEHPANRCGYLRETFYV